jgi:hypothetical protein
MLASGQGRSIVLLSIAFQERTLSPVSERHKDTKGHGRTKEESETAIAVAFEERKSPVVVIVANHYWKDLLVHKEVARIEGYMEKTEGFERPEQVLETQTTLQGNHSNHSRLDDNGLEGKKPRLVW